MPEVIWLYYDQESSLARLRWRGLVVRDPRLRASFAGADL